MSLAHCARSPRPRLASLVSVQPVADLGERFPGHLVDVLGAVGDEAAPLVEPAGRGVVTQNPQQHRGEPAGTQVLHRGAQQRTAGAAALRLGQHVQRVHLAAAGRLAVVVPVPAALHEPDHPAAGLGHELVVGVRPGGEAGPPPGALCHRVHRVQDANGHELPVRGTPGGHPDRGDRLLVVHCGRPDREPRHAAGAYACPVSSAGVRVPACSASSCSASNRAASNRAASNRAASNRAASNRAASNRAPSACAASNRAASDRSRRFLRTSSTTQPPTTTTTTGMGAQVAYFSILCSDAAKAYPSQTQAPAHSTPPTAFQIRKVRYRIRAIPDMLGTSARSSAVSRPISTALPPCRLRNSSTRFQRCSPTQPPGLDARSGGPNRLPNAYPTLSPVIAATMASGSMTATFSTPSWQK